MDDCLGCCCICVTCVGVISSIFRYIPLSACGCHNCTKGKNMDDDNNDDGDITFPSQTQFTADGHRLHAYPPSSGMHMNHEDEGHNAPHPPPRNMMSPPPDYPTAVREGSRPEPARTEGLRVNNSPHTGSPPSRDRLRSESDSQHRAERPVSANRSSLVFSSTSCADRDFACKNGVLSVSKY
ncbi:hypothetical protein B0H11DRAFT_2275416, partial [Mycena galericulata]